MVSCTSRMPASLRLVYLFLTSLTWNADTLARTLLATVEGVGQLCIVLPVVMFVSVALA